MVVEIVARGAACDLGKKMGTGVEVLARAGHGPRAAPMLNDWELDHEKAYSGRGSGEVRPPANHFSEWVSGSHNQPENQTTHHESGQRCGPETVGWPRRPGIDAREL